VTPDGQWLNPDFSAIGYGEAMKITAGIVLMLAGTAFGLSGDDFEREGKNRPFKDALEGKAPPALAVEGWMNSGGAPLEWSSLRGKVVVLDFWGTW